uniref:Death domain-containing protein n=1 Tax=Ursus maritimus TaxID=29073 RepID=A0A452TMF7_URSMA
MWGYLSPNTLPRLLINHFLLSPDLRAAFDIICDNVGKDWRRLARHLKVTDAKIDAIEEKYPRNLTEQRQISDVLRSLMAYEISCRKGRCQTPARAPASPCTPLPPSYPHAAVIEASMTCGFRTGNSPWPARSCGRSPSPPRCEGTRFPPRTRIPGPPWRAAAGHAVREEEQGSGAAARGLPSRPGSESQDSE